MNLRKRRIVRRNAVTPCQAVATDDFSLMGEQILDLSPLGALLACDREAKVGSEVLLSFKCPNDETWVDAAAKVSRVILGYRPGDKGYCAGLTFTDISLRDRMLLNDRLKGTPPPVPQRELRDLKI